VEIPLLADLVEFLGADVLSLSSVIPVGRALSKQDLYFDKESKKKLIEIVNLLNEGKKRRLMIHVNDPLSYINGVCSGIPGEYGGCIAGIAGFSVEPNGLMFPCPVLPNQIIMNINGKNPDEMLAIYRNSSYIHSLLDRRLSGKCGKCDLRFSCGGCRARAEGMTGNFLGEDTDCWL
jgi:radical SAM protein with 4Fe4S-binding SPASM domain